MKRLSLTLGLFALLAAVAASPAGAAGDADGDGIPDEWEVAHGLDPHNPNDAQTMTSDGYTWLEKYLNELAAKALDK